MNASSAQSVAEILAEKAVTLRPEAVPTQVRGRAEQLLIDVVGLCIAARDTDYMKALVAAADAGGVWPKDQAQRFLDSVLKFFESPLDLSLLRG